MRFDLTTLNLVLAIAETRSITRGAERKHLALAAASKRLSGLESRLCPTPSAVPPRTACPDPSVAAPVARQSVSRKR